MSNSDLQIKNKLRGKTMITRDVLQKHRTRQNINGHLHKLHQHKLLKNYIIKFALAPLMMMSIAIGLFYYYADTTKLLNDSVRHVNDGSSESFPADMSEGDRSKEVFGIPHNAPLTVFDPEHVEVISENVPFSVILPTFVPDSIKNEALITLEEIGGRKAIKVLYGKERKHVQIIQIEESKGVIPDSYKRSSDQIYINGIEVWYRKAQYGGPDRIKFVHKGVFYNVRGLEVTKEELINVVESMGLE